MNPRALDEKIKPFRLVKYFTFTSLVLIFIGTLILSSFSTHWARQMQLEKSRDYANLLVENLNHQVFIQFVIPVVMKFGRIQLRDPDQFERMDKVVRSTLHSFKVDMVNIYDKNNTISYSFNKDVIGAKNIAGTGYQNAVLGKSASDLVQRGNLLEIMFGFPEEVKMITFAPLRAEKPLSEISGPVLGVVEIVQDMSQEYKTIFRFQILVVITITAVMISLLLVLIFVVKRGEGIIERRAEERLKLEEQLSRAKHLSMLGEMVACVSHEIRNPLGIIRSSASLLKKKIKAVDPSNTILANTIPDIIVEESGRLNDIIGDFLNFAKPKNPNPAPCLINEVLEKNVSFLAAQIEKEGYIIKRHYDNNLPGIMADSAMLHQAFLNILINGMQAMPDGGEICIKTGLKDKFIVVNIEDEGEGIHKDVVDKIWDPFFTTKEKGTGLGLGIVKNIIEAHGGSIRIDNKPVRGACVAIELPVMAKI
ncbi:MAG: hypothetical protein SRB1_02499 [Desulfobacteraceae bacterium Eth-SRB1]|nr:MAG: hypothetical protein SRB1_02499 [Desulfobacteraceae bacterium Eth-SRB1]